jgi:hypothetical protein
MIVHPITYAERAGRLVTDNICPACEVRTGAAYLSEFAPTRGVHPRVSRSYRCRSGCPQTA